MLEDGDLRLTESSAILKYLASKYDLPSYPKDLKKRAKVDEMMDWFNTQFYRDYGYGLAYPQMYAHHKRPSDEIQAGTIAWGKEQGPRLVQDPRTTTGWGRTSSTCAATRSPSPTTSGRRLATLGEVIRCDFSAYPNVERWLNNMRKLDSWKQVNEAHYGLPERGQGPAVQGAVT